MPTRSGTTSKICECLPCTTQFRHGLTSHPGPQKLTCSGESHESHVEHGQVADTDAHPGPPFSVHSNTLCFLCLAASVIRGTKESAVRATRSLTWRMSFDSGTPCSARASEAPRAKPSHQATTCDSFYWATGEAIWPGLTHFCVAGPKRLRVQELPMNK